MFFIPLCDGSKIKDETKGGFAVCIESFKLHLFEVNSYQASNYASIFTLEAMAILEALISIEDISDQKFSIFSDSMSVLSALVSPINYSKCSYLIIEIK